MPPEITSETRFALEGFLPLWFIALLGVLFLALSAWMAWRDRRFVDRPRLVWLLLALRLVAVVVLLWMLAGPTLVTAIHKFKRKSVAVLVDTSASMGLVDNADGSGNVTRWAASIRDSADARRLRQLDGSVAALLAGQRQLQQFARLPDVTADGAAARLLLAQSLKGITEGAERLKQSADSAPADSLELKRTLRDAAKIIESGVLPILQEKGAEFGRGKSLAAMEREKWVPKQLEQLSLTIQGAVRTADQFTKSVEEHVGKDASNVKSDDARRSRLEKVQAFIASGEAGWLKELGTKATINRYEFGERVVPVSAPSSDDPKSADVQKKVLSQATRLGAALQQVALDNMTQPVAAAIVITDGGQNAGRDPREIAPSLAGTSLHIVPIGNSKMERDVILHHTHTPKAVLQNDTAVTEAVITAYGCEKESLRVELLDGDTVVEQQTLNVTGDVFDARMQLRWKASTIGKHTLGVRVRPVAGERDDENNSAKADVQVMEEKISVLVADNFPRWETRYLLNLFKRDDRVTFDQLLFEPQRSRGPGVRSGFPASLEEWSKYRIVILGDVLPSQLKAADQKLLRDYVTEGGGNLIMVAGRDAMPAAYVNEPLGALCPVLPGDRPLMTGEAFYLHPGDEASQTLATQIAADPVASERVWREMSQRVPIYGMSDFSKPKPTTHSLIWASRQKNSFDLRDVTTRSFLAWHYVGGGRVVYLAAPVTYQLRYRQGDTFHHRFWGQLLRWVVARDLAEGSQTVRFGTDKLRYEIGESLQVAAQLRQLDGKAVSGAALKVEAWQHGKLLEEVSLKEDSSRPGSYHGVVSQSPPGSIRLQLLGDRVSELLSSEKYTRPIETTISIDPSAMVELRHPLCNLPLLREIADAGGGLVIPPTGLEAALQQLNLDPEKSENITRKALWNRWDLFCLFIGCLSLEWAGRKFLGLS